MRAVPLRCRVLLYIATNPRRTAFVQRSAAQAARTGQSSKRTVSVSATSDTIFMRRALELARQGSGLTAPNPMVGAVIVREGRTVGEGFHPRAGQAHAEIRAIESATVPLAGADMYCTLEPCSHDTPAKRTPPCVHRIIQERFRRVVVSTIDPNPHVDGRGVAILREAGIDVSVGSLDREATLLNAAYFKYIQTGLPLVHLKVAMSLDGRIATRTSDSRWITDGDARTRVHEMRHASDAVLVGANTARIDNPRLTVRHLEGRQPRRIILDETLTLPRDLTVFSDDFRTHTQVITTAGHDPEQRRWLERQGVRVEVVPTTATGMIDLKAMLRRLGEQRITSILVEGGGEVVTAFIRNGLFDSVAFFVAPILLGRGVDAVGDLQVERVADALRLQLVTHTPINDQWLIEGYRDPRATFGKLADKVLCLPDS